jgi:hypothetical protein
MYVDQRKEFREKKQIKKKLFWIFLVHITFYFE